MDGASLRAIGEELDRSIATVRYWLERWGIQRPDARRRRFDPATAPQEVELECVKHGFVMHRLAKRGSYHCPRCSQEQVAARRREVKRILIADAGGRCAACGYDRCAGALQFHHLNPEEKRFGLSSGGVTRSLAAARAEATKCVLLCANCHAEVESGLRSVAAA